MGAYAKVAPVLGMIGLFVAAAGATYVVAQEPGKPANNAYRWPIPYGEEWTLSQGQENGATGPLDSHRSERGLEYSLDLFHIPNAPVWAAREGVARCEDWRLSGTGLGWVVRVVHGKDSDVYAHGDQCYNAQPWSETPAQQGRHIAYTGSSGTTLGDFSDHLHFMRVTDTTGIRSAPVTIEGISAFPDSVYQGAPVGTNLGTPGYGGKPLTYDAEIGALALEIGWETLGSAQALPYWTPGERAFRGCAEESPGFLECAFVDVNGFERKGRIQTFKAGDEPDRGEHAIMKFEGGPAVFVSRGLLAPFTNAWDQNQMDGLYYLGFPRGPSYPLGEGKHRMDFQNGYAIYDENSCHEKPARFFAWSSLVGHFVEAGAGAYCD